MPDLDVPCATCENMLKATVANPHIVNMYAATMIIIEHPIPVHCPLCDRLMVVTVLGLGQVILSARSPNDLQTTFDFDGNKKPPSPVM
jgi:hypothetical protein